MPSDTEDSFNITHSNLLTNKFKSSSAVVDSTPTLQSKVALSNDSININTKDAVRIPQSALGRVHTYSNDSDLSMEEDDCDVRPTEMDFVEYNFSTIKGNESYTVLDRGFGRVGSLKDNDNLSKEEEVDQLTRTRSPIKRKRSRELDINEESDDADDWKEINTQLECGDIYNLKGEKVDFFLQDKSAASGNESSDALSKQKEKESIGVGKKIVGAVTGVKQNKEKEQQLLLENYHKTHALNSDKTQQGYTRIDVEKQAKKFEEMDKKFDFLFQNENSNLRKLHQQQSRTNTSSSALATDSTIQETEEFVVPDKFNEIYTKEGRPEVSLDATSQMMSTKSMLNDNQKIAYAALVKLLIVKMNTSLAELRGSGSTSVLKKLATSNKSFMRWSIHIMNALYDHLDINRPEERSMIETLSCHGVESKDLTKVFDKKIVIENHLKEEESDIQVINVDESSAEIEIDIKWTLICDFFLILLEASVYDARSRTLLMNFADSIGINNLEIHQFERRITDSLEVEEIMEIMQNQPTLDEKDILKHHKRRNKNQKIAKIALATAAGGLVIGLSAGALAPVIGAGLAAGLTTIGIGGTSGFLAGTAGTAIITTGGVLSGMRAGGNAMNNRAGSVNTFEFIPLHNNKRVNLIITVSGWMSGTLDDVRLPFSTVDQVMGDLYSLLWEPDMLTSMGQTIGILANEILTQSIQQILGSTLLITLMSGLQLPLMLSKLGYILDNPWNVSLDRAWTAGLILADTLRKKKLGGRPITLIGFSLGARLIYSCLLSLAKSGEFGIIENVYLFGSPLVIKEDEIALARSVVSGRFINGYVKQDWILGYLFRATSGGLRTIAGLSPIEEDQYNIENVDCAELVAGHMQYREAMPKLLKKVGWEVLEDQFVEIDQPNPEEEERQRKLLTDFEKAQHGKKKKGWYNKLFGKSKNTEWWEMYEEGEKEKKEKKMFDVAALQKEVENIEKEAGKKESKKSSKKKGKGKGKDKANADIVMTNIITGDSKLPKAVETTQRMSDEKEVNSIADGDKDHKINQQIKEGSITPKLSDPYAAKFHCSPKSKPSQATQKDLNPKQLRTKRSLIQLVDSAETKDHTTTTMLDKKEDGKLKSFNIHAKSDTLKPNAKRFSFLNIKSEQDSLPGNDNNFSKVPSVKQKTHGLGFDIVKVTEAKNEAEEAKEENETLVAKNEPIDYGEDFIPNQKDGEVEIAYDEDFDNLMERVKEKHRNTPGFGVVTELDYGDEEEFPQDESHIAVSFA